MAQITESESKDFTHLICILALTLLCFACFFVRIGHLSMIGPDEPRYTQVAREMYESGDWITPNLAGIHWFEKPALTYWLIASSYTIFGVSEFAARFPIALYSSLGVFLLLWFGKRINSFRFGYLAAAALVSSGIWIGFSRAATFDLPLSVSIEITLLSFYLWFQNRKSIFWYLFCFGLGLSVLAKGLVGIVLPAAIIGLFLLLTRELFTVLKAWKLLVTGAVVFLLTAATWYVPMFVRYGQEFWQEFFVAHHFQRFLTNKYHHPQPFYFFTFVAILGCLPWTLLFLAQIGNSLKNWRAFWTKPDEQLRLFLWLWVIVFVGFFSASTSKLTGYILPAFPAIALLIGHQLHRWWENPPPTIWRWLLLAMNILLVVLAIGLALRSEKIQHVAPINVMLLAGIIALVALITISLLFVRGEKAATIMQAFTMAGIIAGINFTVLNNIETNESTAALVSAATKAARPSERLVFYINNDHSIDFYAPKLPMREGKSELVTYMDANEIAKVIPTHPSQSLLVMAPHKWLQGLQKAMSVEMLSAYDSWVLVRVTIRNPRPQ